MGEEAYFTEAEGRQARAQAGVRVESETVI